MGSFDRALCGLWLSPFLSDQWCYRYQHCQFKSAGLGSAGYLPYTTRFGKEQRRQSKKWNRRFQALAWAVAVAQAVHSTTYFTVRSREQRQLPSAGSIPVHSVLNDDSDDESSGRLCTVMCGNDETMECAGDSQIFVRTPGKLNE